MFSKAVGHIYRMCKMRNAKKKKKAGFGFFLKMNPMNNRTDVEEEERKTKKETGAQAKTSSSIVQQRSH